MTKEKYIALMNFWQDHKKLLSLAAVTQKSAELAVYIVYPLFISYLTIKGDMMWLYSLLICGLGFAAISLLRKLLNRPRPYEKYGIGPAVKKDTKGCSFPSRHAFSAAVIAVNIFAVYEIFGIIVLALALIIATLRVLLGFHFIKDVVLGIASGLLIGSFIFLA